MSLSEWITWLQQHNSASLVAFLALILFLSLYGATEWRTARNINSRLRRFDSSLQLYAAAESPLIQAAGRPELSSEEELLVAERLLACRAAPYITADVLAQISAYAGDRDTARLPLLIKTLERESERLCAERDKLLRQSESPGWGYALWKQIRSALPFLFAAALLYLIVWLVRMLSGEIPMDGHRFEEYLNHWAWFASAIFSLLLLYPALMGGNRPNAGAVLLRIWSVFIAGLYLLHLLGPTFAPYILTVQIMLFIAGFRFTGNKPRKSRPFVGHYSDEEELEPVETAEGASGAQEVSYGQPQSQIQPQQPQNNPDEK
ncbi:hypothetical protein KB559_12150 [Paenibacillus sp. Marseille-P2973]|uniref:hypothetical protein n=1 Tax=Paenibacillus sp. Marseille-P2973 TaxID=1871032 RepID=UPI001B37F1B3|nr:hypothetical protein [Paenibacillus sp. Marseille-P2973]MBQ4899592.1 hypothetical protein [Paenibacillus sp. Marseille-P2973]